MSRLLVRIGAPIALACALNAALIIPTFVPEAMAQPKPAQQADLITRGRTLFEDQQYEESIQTLSAALVRPSNTKDQKVEVYRLLALNFITLNRKDEAESAVRGLLALKPDYELPPSESPRFRDFFSGVRKKWEDDGRPGVQSDAAPPPAEVSTQHVSPSQVDQGNEVPLSIKIEDPQGRVFEVRLFYRSSSKGKFEQIATVLGNNVAKATIPKTAVKPPVVEYYFQGFDKGGLPIVSRGDAAAPLRIAVPEPSKVWVIPVVIGGSVLAVAGAIGIMAALGVFSSGKATVSINVNE